ncbi:MAG: hypothetical protein HYW04_13855 [Deltaproteobacteria bacterium]|nr:hypothetical protein [Deltaproteobacteria bacterium]
MERGAFHAVGGNELPRVVQYDDGHAQFLLARVGYRGVDDDARLVER